MKLAFTKSKQFRRVCMARLILPKDIGAHALNNGLHRLHACSAKPREC